MNVDEEQTLSTLTSHRSIVDALIEKAHGQIFGTAGDSVLAEFPSKRSDQTNNQLQTLTKAAPRWTCF
ncbi:hypothetical protein ACCS92_38165, partial [Rhizobium ruizarguesonis]